MRRIVVAMAMLLAGCGGGSGSVVAPTTSAAPATTSTIALLRLKERYAAQLLLVRHQYLFHGSGDVNYGQAAEALNQIVPPAGFELRHKQLVADMLALSAQDFGGSLTAAARQGAAEGKAESDLLNLAHEADPSSGY